MKSELEHKLINAYKEEMISFLKTNPEYLKEAVDLAVSDKHPFCWRAAWLIYNCIEENDYRMNEYIHTIIQAAEVKKKGHQRELLKILLKMELTEEQEGILFNICMDVWEDINRKPSERFIALKYIVKMTKKYPELKEEVSFLLQDQYLELLSPGVKRAVSKIAEELKRNKYNE